MSSRIIFSKEDLLKPNLELPSISKLASIFRSRKFKLEILPYKEGEPRLFKANCTSCNYNIIVKWPINTSNLEQHFNTKHFSLNINNSNNNLIEGEDIIEDNNSNIESSSFSTNNTNTINSYFKTSIIRKRPSFILFSKEDYKNYLLSFIINNNLPFSIVESNSP
jgi:hypothetical protein